jgi:aconitate hydratase
MPIDPFGALTSLELPEGSTSVYRLSRLEDRGVVSSLDRLPFSIRILLENALRHAGGGYVDAGHVEAVASWSPTSAGADVPFMPSRVVLQDFTGVPAVVDLAAMRDGIRELGGDPAKINPVVPADLVIDHSVQVDHFGTSDAFRLNVEREFERNRERYALLRWAQEAFDGFSVVPPGTGIVHQVNLEYLASVVHRREHGGRWVAFPDTCVGTDSHTTMINGIGVVGWGVGGIEAEAVMLGQPYYMLLPEVVGMKLTGALPEGATATDLVLRVTEMLRAHGVVGRFVEFFGSGLSGLTLPDKATLANMAPEYGATIGFFPVDGEALRYLRGTGRPADVVTRVERVCKELDLFRTDDTPDPEFTSTVELDLSSVEPSLAGPKRPQDRIPLADMRSQFHRDLPALIPAGPAHRRRHRGHRRHHVLHQHVQSLGDGGSGPPRQEGGGERALGTALGQDLHGPGVQGGDRLPGRRGSAGAAGGAQLPGGGLRLHDVHRELGPTARGRPRRGAGAWPGGGLGPFRQPELRGPHSPARESQLPGLSGAGGGLRPGRPGRHRPP